MRSSCREVQDRLAQEHKKIKGRQVPKMLSSYLMELSLGFHLQNS